MAEQSAIWIVAIAILLYAIYYLISLFPAGIRWLWPILEREKSRQRVIYLQKLNGFALLGVLPAIYLLILQKQPLSEFGVNPAGPELWWYLAGALVLLVPANYFIGRSPGNLARFPLIRHRSWTGLRIALSLGFWALYLTGYEFFFRGFLFFGTLEAWGFWPAIIINLSFYSAVHRLHNLQEAMAAIPFGFLICLITYQTSSVLPAILIHIVLAWSNELWSIHHHPEMSFSLMRRAE